MVTEYEKKREEGSTPEPFSDDRPEGFPNPFFVVHKHDASNLHYDFRLEVDGALASWAVPKGPSTDPSEKRLAIRTEDHPLEYGGFEGVIPEDEYGAGTVLVWDRGPYENITEKDGETQPAAEALDDGHFLVRLDGEKIRGGYALQRIRSGDDEQWLLIKMDDDEADARRNPVSTEPDSVLSGRSIDDIAEDEREASDE
ncbi:MAG: DNA polymerase ligase N-terminal domain-containing protein [Halobacteriales archaeon]|nr:DNA polymerase ligase N-terminal domain-containing protein [Halobacteriales archaeon]